MGNSHSHRAYDKKRADNRPVLVVIGGGFAGVMAAQKMSKQFRVHLIDAKEYFEYYPGICRAYVHPREHQVLSRHYLTICDQCRANFVWGEVVSVDYKTKSVQIDGIAQKKNITLKYDYLMITAGCQYGLDIVHDKRASSAGECLWYPTFLKESIELSAWEGIDERFLIGRRTHIETEYKVLAEMHKKKETILVVGAGPVGIEFATEVKHYFPGIEILIVESRGTCIGSMPKSCINYVQKYLDKNGIKTIYEEKYSNFLTKSDVCSSQRLGACGNFDNHPEKPGSLDALPELSKKWGVDQPSRIYMAVGLRSLNKFLPHECLTEMKGTRGGWIKVNIHQQVLGADGSPIEGVFAAGNCCDAPGGEMNVPKNVAPAETMCSVACHNIRVIEGQKNKGCCRPSKLQKMHHNFAIGIGATSLGPNDATIVICNKESGTGCFVLSGCLAAVSKEFVRWSKVDAINGGCFGKTFWKIFH